MEKDLETLREMVVDVWTQGFMGVDVGQLVIALLIFGGFLVIRGLFARIIINRVHKWTEKSANDLDDKIIDALTPPLKFIPVILGIFFSTQYMDLNGEAGALIMKVERSLIAFVMFWAFYRAADPLSHSLKKLEKILTKSMMQWIFKTLKFLVIFIGGAVILEIWGIAVGPLLAGLGLFGAAIALGAQDLFKNLIGGFTIIAEKKFHPGEWIKVDGVVEGTVDDIGFRSTKIVRFDKAPVHVPNSALSDAVVTNFSRMTHRRIKWKVGIKYDASVEQLKTIRDEIAKELATNEAFAPADEVSTFVRVDSFNDSSIDFLIYCFTKTTNWGEWLEIKEAFAMKIKEIVADASTDFAFPSQSLYLESTPGDAAEIFIPPKG